MRNKSGLSIALVLAVLALNGSCAHMTVPRVAMMNDSTHCPGGQGHPHESGPVICIDATTWSANPDHQKVHRGGWVHFYLTDVNQELDIDFKEPAKVHYKGRKGNECWVRVKDDAPLGSAPYTTKNLTTHQQHDPEIVIEP